MASGTSRLVLIVYVGAMIAIIVGLDLAFFRQRILERLMLNAGVVLVFAAFYLRFLRTAQVSVESTERGRKGPAVSGGFPSLFASSDLIASRPIRLSIHCHQGLVHQGQ